MNRFFFVVKIQIILNFYILYFKKILIQNVRKFRKKKKILGIFLKYEMKKI